MKRQYAYIVKVTVNEPAKGKGGDGQSKAQELLSEFEETLEKIELENEGTTLMVTGVSMTSRSKEAHLPSGERQFTESKQPSFGELRARTRGRARRLIGG